MGTSADSTIRMDRRQPRALATALDSSTIQAGTGAERPMILDNPQRLSPSLAVMTPTPANQIASSQKPTLSGVSAWFFEMTADPSLD
jgi:hypothetical protein